jgi:hypothetical protein
MCQHYWNASFVITPDLIEYIHLSTSKEMSLPSDRPPIFDLRRLAIRPPLQPTKGMTLSVSVSRHVAHVETSLASVRSLEVIRVRQTSIISRMTDPPPLFALHLQAIDLSNPA